MTDDNEGMSPERLSRRTVIKRAGVAGAVVWTAPLLSSVTNPAHAAGSAVPCPQGCDPNNPCGGGQPVCGPSCGCVPEEGSGDCFCHQGSSCGAITPCTATSQCPDGFICANSCCGFAACLPPCGSPGVFAEGARGGAMSTG